jgi:hypothetical protein
VPQAGKAPAEPDRRICLTIRSAEALSAFGAARKESRDMPQLDPNASFEELPDPLAPSRHDLLGGSEEDLLSRMAGDEVDRLLSADDLVPLLGHGAVQEMKSQIGNFFDQLHQRERKPATPKPVTAPAPEVLPPATESFADPMQNGTFEPIEERIEIEGAERMALHAEDIFDADDPSDISESSQALLAPVAQEIREPLYLKPLNWLSDPIASLSGGGRALVSTGAVVSFIGACAALAYVLVLTHGQS